MSVRSFTGSGDDIGRGRGRRGTNEGDRAVGEEVTCSNLWHQVFLKFQVSNETNPFLDYLYHPKLSVILRLIVFCFAEKSMHTTFQHYVLPLQTHRSDAVLKWTWNRLNTIYLYLVKAFKYYQTQPPTPPTSPCTPLPASSTSPPPFSEPNTTSAPSLHPSIISYPPLIFSKIL